MCSSMLIGFEASALYGYKSGVGYYTENLLSGVMRVAPQHEYIMFSNRDLSDSKRLAHERVYGGGHFPVRAAWMQAVLPGTLRKVRPDLCHFTNYLAPVVSSVPYVVTIYDMTLFIMPSYHRFKKLVLDRTLIPIVARRAKAVITISHSARKDIVKHLKVPAGKVKVIPGGVSTDFAPVRSRERLEGVRARYGLHDPYVLYVGTIEPRKNLVRLVQAFARVKREGLPHKLAIVGQQGWHCEPVFAEVERLGLKKEIVFTGYVPFEDLPVLYSGAECMAFPSLYEGFGLPVIEAMACGVPVVTSDSSSLTEVGREAALLVDPYSVEDIADALMRIHFEADLREHLSEQGISRASYFTWEKSARSAIEVYEAIGVKGH